MSRVGAWHIGIERLDLAHAEPFAPPLPERHLLAPDGRPVETHVASLYPAQQAAACLLGERDEDERLLQMALNLLHKV
ncbi:hypothetical protein [Pseudomonas aeruginosa]|uniref:type III secretion apparatus assembly protein SctX n=1 Tax=Pseudomonas aeruginosa TaxID=287 RepID=UPI00053E2066|nr:hypothetical protein [Pseudomonas aeruginosa]